MITLLDEYQTESSKTMRAGLSAEEMNKYCALKICEEAGEVGSIIAKHYYHGKEFKRDALRDEIGDLFWYVANMAKANGFTLSEIATNNIEKLRKRHGDSYNAEFYVRKE